MSRESQDRRCCETNQAPATVQSLMRRSLPAACHCDAIASVSWLRARSTCAAIWAGASAASRSSSACRKCFSACTSADPCSVHGSTAICRPDNPFSLLTRLQRLWKSDLSWSLRHLRVCQSGTTVLARAKFAQDEVPRASRARIFVPARAEQPRSTSYSDQLLVTIPQPRHSLSLARGCMIVG